MAIRYPEILSLKDERRLFAWDYRDTLLYASAVGCGTEQKFFERERIFLLPDILSALPTQVSVIPWGAGVRPHQMGLTRHGVVHTAESIRLHRPLGVHGSIYTEGKVTNVWDRKEKGATIEREILLFDAANDEPLATITRTANARLDGGFGGPAPSEPIHYESNNPPDGRVELRTSTDQALLFRLCGDRNPLHVDPAVATAAGFNTPILHGLCSLGFCCRAFFISFPEIASTSVRAIRGTFSRPLVPGDCISVQFWQAGLHYHFTASRGSDDQVIVRDGLLEIDE